MDINKDVCINCIKRDNCATRDEIHSDNFYVSECDEFTARIEPISEYEKLKQENKALLIENIKLKYSGDATMYCDSQENCWAKSDECVCRTIENCPYKITTVEHLLKEISK